jgi:thioredoxin 1
MGRNPLPLFMGLGAIALLIAAAQKPKAATPVVVPSHPAAPQRPDVVVLVDFSAKWCGPCQKMKAVIDEFESEGNKVYRVDADLNEAMMKQYGVESLPTFIATRDGKELGRKVGVATIEDLRRLIGKAAAKVQVSPLRVVDEEPKHEPDPIFGPTGWRLRLFYPPRSESGQRIADNFANDPKLAALAKQYGYQVVTTDMERFDDWRGLGYRKDQLTLVLVDPSGDIVLKQHSIAKDPQKILAELRAAIDKRDSWMPDQGGWNDWQLTNGGWSSGRRRR